MSIYKFLIAVTLMFVSALLIGGMYYPNSFAMIMADTSTMFTALRAVICVLLFGLLVTNPPRSLALRTSVGVGSLFLLGITVYQLMNFQMFILDAIVFVEVAIIFAIEAFESRRVSIPVREKRSTIQRIPVYIN